MTLMELMAALKGAEARDSADYRLQLFPDGSGGVYMDFPDDSEARFEFDRVVELEKWLEKSEPQGRATDEPH